MKAVRIMFLLQFAMSVLVALLSTGCAVGDNACVGQCEGELGEVGSARGTNQGRLSVYTVDDEFIGYAVSNDFGFINVYIPSYRSYVDLHPKTGEYQEHPVSQHEEIYFDSKDCSGNAIVVNWDGKVGSTYLKAKNRRTYVVQSTTYYSKKNTFKAQSKLVANRPAHDSCWNSSYNVMTFAANLVEQDAMPDLSPYAPFKLFSEE